MPNKPSLGWNTQREGLEKVRSWYFWKGENKMKLRALGRKLFAMKIAYSQIWLGGCRNKKMFCILFGIRNGLHRVYKGCRILSKPFLNAKDMEVLV